MPDPNAHIGAATPDPAPAVAPGAQPAPAPATPGARRHSAPPPVPPEPAPPPPSEPIKPVGSNAGDVLSMYSEIEADIREALRQQEQPKMVAYGAGGIPGLDTLGVAFDLIGPIARPLLNKFAQQAIQLGGQYAQAHKDEIRRYVTQGTLEAIAAVVKALEDAQATLAPR